MKFQKKNKVFKTPKQFKKESNKEYVKRIYQKNKVAMSERFYNQSKSEFTKIKAFLKSVKQFNKEESYKEQLEKLFNTDTYRRPHERFAEILGSYVEEHYQEIIVLLEVTYGYMSGMTQGYITKRGKFVSGHEYLKTSDGKFVQAWDGDYYEKTRVKIKGDVFDRYLMKTTAGDTWYLYITKYAKHTNTESFVDVEKLGEED